MFWPHRVYDLPMIILKGRFTVGNMWSIFEGRSPPPQIEYVTSLVTQYRFSSFHVFLSHLIHRHGTTQFSCLHKFSIWRVVVSLLLRWISFHFMFNVQEQHEKKAKQQPSQNEMEEKWKRAREMNANLFLISPQPRISIGNCEALTFDEWLSRHQIIDRFCFFFVFQIFFVCLFADCRVVNNFFSLLPRRLTSTSSCAVSFAYVSATHVSCFTSSTMLLCVSLSLSQLQTICNVTSAHLTDNRDIHELSDM